MRLSRGSLIGIASIYATLGVVSLCGAIIAITEVQALSFPDTLNGVTVDVVVLPTDGNAAIFNITGTASVAVTASVVEASIVMVNPVGNPNAAGNKITVTNWSYGGTVAADGTAFMDASGELNNVRIGGTAKLSANDNAGSFAGTATFRFVYQ